MRMDYEQIRLFLHLLSGIESSVETWQVFYDPKGEAQRPDLANHFKADFNSSIEYLECAQANKCGVHVCINETDGVGRSNENIIRYRAVFADFDGMAEPTWPITPTFTTGRDSTHGHAFWLVNDIASPDIFTSLQKRISLCMRTDHQVTDLARVVRVCGTGHFKDPSSPQMYRIMSQSGARYTTEQILLSFTLTAEQDATLVQWLNNRDGLDTGVGYESSERYNQAFIKWLEIAPVAVEGNGSATVIRVASWAHDRGIPIAEAQEIMWELYNPRCVPPWDDTPRWKHDFYDTVRRAYQYATSAAGCKTAVAEFSRLPELPVRVDGWTPRENITLSPDVVDMHGVEVCETVIGEGVTPIRGRLTPAQADVLLLQLTEKSAHYDLARAFDGKKYNGGDIIRHEKQFLLFNGKSYKEVSDENIKAEVFHFYAIVKPNDTFTRGVFNVFCDLVNVPRIEVGSWLRGGRKSQDMIVFNNGIVDITSESQIVEPHNRDFFTFNELDYDYDASATCNVWKEFLNISICDTDGIKMLQEYMGYCLTKNVLFQKFLLLFGKSRAGKGLITDIITQTVGKNNISSSSLSNLADDHVIHDLSTSSVNFIPDAHNVNFAKRDLVLSKFKAMTGGDSITFGRKYKGAMTCKIPCKHVMSTNNVPEFVDSSGALANRMLVLAFLISFSGREDINLSAKLSAEVAGIAQWAMEGYRRLIAQGKFTESEASLLEKQDIREDMFPLSQFVNQMCVFTSGCETPIAELYAAYKLHCTMTGNSKPFNELQFGKTMRNSELDIVQTRRPDVNGRKMRCFEGIKLSSDITDKLSIGFRPVEEVNNDEIAEG